MAGPYYTNTKIDGVDFIAEADLEAIETGFAGVDADKANKLVPATTNDFAGLSATGDLVDTGKTPPTGDIVGESDTQTLSNKTFTIPFNVNDTSADHQYVFAVNELAANRTVTLPLLGASDEFVFATHAATLANKTLTLPQLNDTSANHQYVFAVSELAADRTVTWPLLLGNDQLVFNDHIATLLGKTLQDAVFLGSIGEETYTLSGVDWDATNGTIQSKVMSSSPTFTSSLIDGQSITLHLEGGLTYTPIWPTITWITGVAPTLTNKDVLVFWYIGAVLYGLYVGAYT